MRSTRLRRSLVALAVTSIALAPLAFSPSTAIAAKKATCAKANHAGGDWPSYGANLQNTRAQQAEKKIDPSTAGSLTAAWTFTADIEGGETGAFQSTPVIAEGCVYMTNGSGWIY